MPKPYEKQVGRTPALEAVSQPQVGNVVARPVDTFVAPAQTQLSQLASGLASLNPALAKYAHEKNTTDAHDAVAAGEAQARLEAVDPTKALTSPGSLPDGIDPIFAPNFQKGYKSVLGARLGDNAQDEILNEWYQQRMTGDPEQFIAEATAKHLSGFTDPTVLEEVTKRHEATVKAIRSDARSVAFQKLSKSTTESVNTMFGEVNASQTTEQMFSTFKDTILPKGLATGFYTRTELAGQFLDRLNALSQAQNGSPEVFQAFLGDPDKDGKPTLVDPVTGKSLADMNPDLAAKAEGYRKAAEARRDQRLGEAMQTVNYQKMVNWQDRIAKGDYPTDDEIKGEIGKLGMFPTDNAALSFRHGMQVQRDKAASLIQAVNLTTSGMLGLVGSDADQRKAMDAVTDAPIRLIFSAVNDPSPVAQQAVRDAVGRVLHLHQQSGGSVPSTRLKNAFEAIGQQFPGKDSEPSPMFKMLANAYAQMPPNLKQAYAPEDVRTVLEQYNSATTNGASVNLDPKSAYQQAYQAITPEAKATATRLATDREHRSQVKGWVENLTTEWYRDIAGFQALGTYPTNEDAISEIAQIEARNFKMRNPNASDSVVKSHVQGWYGQRFIHDTASNLIVEVPGGDNSQSTRQAISDFSAKARTKYPDAEPQLRHMGNGSYQLWTGAGTKMIESGIQLADIKDEHRYKTALDPRTGEGERLTNIKKALVAGTMTAAVLASEAPLIAKASAVGAWDKDLQAMVTKIRRSEFIDSMSKLSLSAPLPTNEGIDVGLQKSSPGRGMTDMAKAMWQKGRWGESLTVMSEGLRLTAYKDNKGSAIGVGYNMDANSKTLAEDFRRSGIPASSIEAIKAGTASITEDQAMRLYQVSYGRATQAAQAGVERLYGQGEWLKLPPNKQAVLVDIAYQVGSVDKFIKGVGSLVNGDDQAAMDHLKVKYRQRSDGKFVEDTPRNNLRFHMLNGTGTFGGLIDEVARKPRSIIEAKVAAAQPQ